MAEQENEDTQIPYKPKQDASATLSDQVGGQQTKQGSSAGAIEYDWSKPYGGIVDKVWGKPQIDREGIARNNRIIKTQGIADMLRLVGEAVTGSMGGDIIKRGENKISAKAEADNRRLMDIFKSDQARYNAMKMQEMLRNMEYGVRQRQRKEDRVWQTEMFDKRTAIADERMKKQFEHSDKVSAENKAFQEKMFDKRTAVSEKMADKNFNRQVTLFEKKQGVKGGADKPYIQILGTDGVPVNLNQGQYYYILNQISKDPEIQKTIDGLMVAGDNASKNKLGMLVQEYAQKFFDVRGGGIYRKGSGNNTQTEQSAGGAY